MGNGTGSGGNAVILMAKAPTAGRVKTRLSPPLSPVQAARLYARMLRDTAAAIGRARCARHLFLDPPGREGRFRGGPFRGFRLHDQGDGDLGVRMSRAIETVLAGGALRVAVVGADCPSLSARRLAEAFRELREGADAVFGPTPDGGFYLAGFSRFPRALFGPGVAWGTETVLETVVRRCRRRGIAYSLLPPERDIDTPEDLEWLKGRPGSGRAGAGTETRERFNGGG